MKLIIIYGPPASGKLTIAKALAQATDAPLFHNHLVADFAHSFFQFGTKEFIRLAKKLRMLGVATALDAKIPKLIMTFAYGLETGSGAGDDAVLKTIMQKVSTRGGSVLFVQLVCKEGTLLKRVGRADRKKFHKLTSRSVLKNILLDVKKTQEAIAFVQSITIDTDQLSPEQAVQKILSNI